jgi:hypothetical protein
VKRNYSARLNKYLEAKLQVVQQLRQYARLTQHITGRETAGRDWYLIKMMPDEKKVYVNWYTLERFQEAKRTLAETETGVRQHQKSSSYCKDGVA